MFPTVEGAAQNRTPFVDGAPGFPQIHAGPGLIGGQKINRAPALRIHPYLNLVRGDIVPLLRVQKQSLIALAAGSARAAGNFGLSAGIRQGLRSRGKVEPALHLKQPIFNGSHPATNGGFILFQGGYPLLVALGKIVKRLEQTRLGIRHPLHQVLMRMHHFGPDLLDFLVQLLNPLVQLLNSLVQLPNPLVKLPNPLVQLPNPLVQRVEPAFEFQVQLRDIALCGGSVCFVQDGHLPKSYLKPVPASMRAVRRNCTMAP